MPAKKVTKGKKAAAEDTSAQDESVKEQVQKVSSESESNDGNSEEEVDWVHESNNASDNSRNARPRKPSVLDFDRDEVAALEKKKVSEISTEELVKVVIRRGELEKNPVLFGGCGRLLKQINGERLAPRRGGYRGRGGFRGRGGNRGFRSNRDRAFDNGEDNEDNDQYDHRHTRQDQRSGNLRHRQAYNRSNDSYHQANH